VAPAQSARFLARARACESWGRENGSRVRAAGSYGRIRPRRVTGSPPAVRLDHEEPGRPGSRDERSRDERRREEDQSPWTAEPRSLSGEGAHRTRTTESVRGSAASRAARRDMSPREDKRELAGLSGTCAGSRPRRRRRHGCGSEEPAAHGTRVDGQIAGEND